MKGFFTKKEVESASRPNGKPLTCTSCGLYRHCSSPKLKPFGNFKKGILNIGEAPSKYDDVNGIPWQGKEGNKLKKTYKHLGIDLFEDCLNMNAINCFPTNEKGHQPASVQVDNCRKFIIAAIREYKPKVIVLFGQSALYSVLKSRWNEDLGDINKWRGWAIPDQDYDAWVIPLFNPLHVLRDNVKGDKPEINLVWEKDLAQVAEKIKTPLPVFKEPVIEIIETLEPLRKIEFGTIAFDYETTGLKPHAKGHRIVCVSVADSEDHVYVGMMPTSTSGREPFRELMRSHRIQKMAHNMKFEDTWTKVRLKTDIIDWQWDSMLAAHLLDNREGVTGLKFQAYVNFGVPDYSSEVSHYLKAKEDKNANSINRIDELLILPGGKNKLLKYCALDSIYEYRLAMLQRSIIKPIPF